MPIASDGGFDIRCAELALRLLLRFCLGFAHRAARIRPCWRRMTAPVISQLVDQIGNLQGMAKPLVLHSCSLIYLWQAVIAYIGQVVPPARISMQPSG
jgi:hypothetical protein